MADGVKIAHVRDRSIPLVEGAPAVGDRLGVLGTQDMFTQRRLLLLHRDDRLVEHQPARTLCLTGVGIRKPS